MSDTTITALPLASGIDGATDWLAIDRTSLGATQRINRNTYLGITGSPVGTSDSQALTNKTIGNTNTVTLKDTLFTLQDDGDTTKQAKFQLSGITTGTTCTYTLPNASSTLADTSTAQTFTNKTLTSPTINNGSITGTTITTDAIVGQSAATSGTIYGLAVSTSKISGASITNATIPTVAIADSAITPAKLLTGTGSSWVWQSWTPTWTNVTVGNGTVTAYYTQIGKTIAFHIRLVLGSTSAISGQPTFTIPVTANSTTYLANNTERLFPVHIEDTGVQSYYGRAGFASTTTILAQLENVAGTYPVAAAISSTIPMTWGTGDQLSVSGVYDAA